MDEVTFVAYGSRAQVQEDWVVRCARLFSEHYGVWSVDAPQGLRGKRITMSAARFRAQNLFDARSGAVIALRGQTLIGHVFFVRFLLGKLPAVWVTQLVVHSNWRNRGIATELCRLMWRSTDSLAGLVSSHPHAIRALEHATGRHSVSQDARWVIQASGIHYLQGCAIRGALINTGFHVDHAEPMRALAVTLDWQLGPLRAGHEWICCVSRQPPNLAICVARRYYWLRRFAMVALVAFVLGLLAPRLVLVARKLAAICWRAWLAEHN